MIYYSYSKTKREINKAIKDIDKYILFLTSILAKAKELKINKYAIPELRETSLTLIKYNIEKKLLIKRLTCKHINTFKEEFESHHNGDVSTTIICSDCKLILEEV